MRKILFKGKRTDNGEWIEGDLLTDGIDYITAIRVHNSNELGESTLVAVVPETVGQYTGLTDKNGKKIFEGDIMQLCSATYPCLVYWDGKGWAWLANGKRRDIDLTREKMSIIGNIYDNPELLEEKI